MLTKKIYSEGFASSEEAALIARRVLSQIIANAAYTTSFLFFIAEVVTLRVLSWRKTAP